MRSSGRMRRSRHLAMALKRNANIDVHLGKTRVSNSTGEQPADLAEILPTAPGEAPVRVGDMEVFSRHLAKARACESPARPRAALHRWTGMLALAVQHALTYSLLELPVAAADQCDGTKPPLGDLLADARDTEPVPASRLPAPC